MSEYRFQIEDLSRTAAATRSDVQGNRTVRTKRRRILMVGMHLTKTRGGISTLTADILKSSFVVENEVRYIASQAEDFGPFRKLLLAAASFVRFVCLCLFWRPLLVYVHMGSNASLYRESLFVLVGKMFRTSVIVHFHAGDIDNYYPLQPKFGRVFIKSSLAKCDRVIAVSLESSRQLWELDRQLKITVIPNAIDTSAFRERSSTAESTFDEPIRILFVGAIGKLKGEKDLIAALARVRNEIPETLVSILGYGAEDLAAECTAHGIADLIEHLGPVSMDDRIAFYERSDIFVLPTYAEAMPMSVIEAMAAGLPVITTNVGGIPELIEHQIEGLLHEPGDITALAHQIKRLANDRTKRFALGTRARSRVDEQMNFSKYVDRLRSEIDSVCGATK
ncbi:MAG: glycosyltransferase family 4 protein [Acidobacteria bacterium]|nr:glycosyltransferase family 4 protein [Acidobacteriota bacterium]